MMITTIYNTMKNLLLFSRLIQFGIVFSFFLPFFFVGCEKSEESATAADTLTTVDTLQIIPSDSTTYSSDSLSPKISQAKDSTDLVTNDTIYENEKESGFSKELINEHEWLSPFLMPDPGVFTGLGLVVNVIRQSIFINILFAFLLILIALSSKFLEKSAIRTQLLINFLAIIFLFLYTPDIFSAHRLWGFGICLSLLTLTMALDIYRLILTHTKNKHT